MDPITILAALAPLVVDGGKAAIQKWLAPDDFKPTKIEDYVSMRNSELEWFKAMNAAGGANQSYPWVEAVIRLMRPAVAVIVIGTWASAHLGAVADATAINNFAAAVGFYLFGDRSLFYARGGAAKR